MSSYNICPPCPFSFLDMSSSVPSFPPDGVPRVGDRNPESPGVAVFFISHSESSLRTQCLPTAHGAPTHTSSHPVQPRLPLPPPNFTCQLVGPPACPSPAKSLELARETLLCKGVCKFINRTVKVGRKTALGDDSHPHNPE